VETPHLWTKINVHLMNITKKKTRSLIYITERFLDRTGNLQLDVELHASGGSGVENLVTRFFELFKRKGTFSRWRSLSLNVSEDMTLPFCFPEVRDIDKFTNLKYIKFVSRPPRTCLDLISTTVTSNLHTLELGAHYFCLHNFHEEYRRIIGLITVIHLWSTVHLPGKYPFPPNVTTMQAYALPDIPIPDIKHLYVKTLKIELFSSLNPVNIVSMIIHVSISGSPANVTVNLPNLLWLTLKQKAFFALQAFKAPSLHTLVIENSLLEVQTIQGPLIHVLRSFHVSKLLMFFLDIRLDSGATGEVMRLFPELSRLELHYPDAESAQKALRHVYSSGENYDICPDMDVIKIILDAPPSEEFAWKQVVWDLAEEVGRTFWRLDTSWPGGAYSRNVGRGKRKRVRFIYPWRSPGN